MSARAATLQITHPTAFVDGGRASLIVTTAPTGRDGRKRCCRTIRVQIHWTRRLQFEAAPSPHEELPRARSLAGEDQLVRSVKKTSAPQGGARLSVNFAGLCSGTPLYCHSAETMPRQLRAQFPPPAIYCGVHP